MVYNTLDLPIKCTINTMRNETMWNLNNGLHDMKFNISWSWFVADCYCGMVIHFLLFFTIKLPFDQNKVIRWRWKILKLKLDNWNMHYVAHISLIQTVHSLLIKYLRFCNLQLPSYSLFRWHCELITIKLVFSDDH